MRRMLLGVLAIDARWLNAGLHAAIIGSAAVGVNYPDPIKEWFGMEGLRPLLKRKSAVISNNTSAPVGWALGERIMTKQVTNTPRTLGSHPSALTNVGFGVVVLIRPLSFDL